MSLILRGVDYGRVLNSAGARGFYAEGYPFHAFWKHLGLDYRDSTFVAKTATLHARLGNMPLDRAHRPRHLKPACIVVKPIAGVVLNAVGLSNPGIRRLAGLWNACGRSHDRYLPRFHPPWMVSIAAVGAGVRERLEEIRLMGVEMREADLPRPFAVQLNVSCPNVEHGVADLVQECRASVDVLGQELRGVSILLKINALLDPKVAQDLPGDGLVVSNTLPWGARLSWGSDSLNIGWEAIFGTGASPLAHLGGGGLSGEPLLDIVREWIRIARDSGYGRPIVGGGGILKPWDVGYLFRAGADAVELGSIGILRPWRVKKTIRAARR